MATTMALVACNAITGDAFDVTLADDAGEMADASVPDAAPDAAVGDGNVVTADASDASDAASARDAADAAAAPTLQISARAANSCGVNAGVAKCWGNDDDDQLGGSGGSASAAEAVPDLGTGVHAIAVGTSHACAAVADGGVVCWGNNANGQVGSAAGAGPFGTPSAVALPENAVAVDVVAGAESSCALLVGGSVVCWGDNASGELGGGDSAPAMSTTPIAVSLTRSAKSLSAGQLHVCAVLMDGSLACWGWNHYGQIGTGDLADQHAPFVVPGLTDVIAVATGDQHTCALTADGTVSCWGANDSGQLGDGTTTARMAPSGDLLAYPSGSAAKAISAGSSHTCALLDDGVHCWGEQTYGQLGNNVSMGTQVSPSSVAVIFPSTVASPVVALAAGGDHSCAIVADGGAFCWGDNSDGQVGDGTTMDNPPTARSVIGW